MVVGDTMCLGTEKKMPSTYYTIATDKKNLIPDFFLWKKKIIRCTSSVFSPSLIIMHTQSCTRTVVPLNPIKRI